MANPTHTKKDDVGTSAGRFGSEVKKQAGEVADKAKDAASSVVEKGKEMAASAAHTAGEYAHAAGEKADSAASSVGGGMKSLAGTIRDRGPQEGVLGSATSAVASTLEKGGKYLQEQGLTGMGEDLMELVKRNPIPAMFVGVAIGYLIACATRRS